MVFKKNIFTSVCLVVLFLCQGCEKDEHEDENEVITRLLTLIVDPSYSFGGFDHWVIIQDRNGTPLAVEPFKSGDLKLYGGFKIYTQNPVPGDNIAITILKHRLGRYELSTTLDYPAGQTMTLRTPKPPFSYENPLPTPIGRFYINFAIDNAFDQLHISNKLGMQTIVFAGQNRSLDLRVTINASTSNYMVHASDIFGNLRYAMFENVKPNDSYKFPFKSMPEFDEVAEFSFPNAGNVDLMVWGHEADQPFNELGYVMTYHAPDHLHQRVKAGYLASLGKYYTELKVTFPQLTLTSPKYFYTYVNRGSVPESIYKWPLPGDYSLVSKSIADFGTRTRNKFNWRTSSWKGVPGTNIIWTVNSPFPAQRLSELPTEILALHPGLTLSNLRYDRTTYYTSNISYTRLLDIDLQEDHHSMKGITIYE